MYLLQIASSGVYLLQIASSGMYLLQIASLGAYLLQIASLGTYLLQIASLGAYLQIMLSFQAVIQVFHKIDSSYLRSLMKILICPDSNNKESAEQHRRKFESLWTWRRHCSTNVDGNDNHPSWRAD